jgi:hypothetical protein
MLGLGLDLPIQTWFRRHRVPTAGRPPTGRRGTSLRPL